MNYQQASTSFEQAMLSLTAPLIPNKNITLLQHPIQSLRLLGLLNSYYTPG